MQYIDVVCKKCAAQPGVACNRPGGRTCEPHSIRVASSIAQAVVPAIAQPVQKLKERFTLQGQPLAISACMPKLGIQVHEFNHGDPSGDGSHFECTLAVGDKNRTWIYDRMDDSWGYAVYPADAETFDTKPVTQAEVLTHLIKLYYVLTTRKAIPKMPDVVQSLSARLLPLATVDQLDALRTEIKKIHPVA